MGQDAQSQQEFPLEGSVAVVTGATRGIGRGAARALGLGGAKIVVVGRSTDANPNQRLPGTVDEAAAALRAEGIEALPVRADLSNPDDAKGVVDRTLAEFGRCDILVNNAAFTSNGPLMEIPPRRWINAFRVAVESPLQMIQGFVPGMLERGGGRVLNVSSNSSRQRYPGLALYSVSKAAMEHLGEFLELEVGGRGVTFNTLRVDRVVPSEGWRFVNETQGSDIATSGRTGEPPMVSVERCAEIIRWLVTRPSDWTGHNVGFEEIAALGGPSPE